MEKPGDRLRRARILRGYSQKQLAKEVGCVRHTIGRLESSRYHPNIEFAAKVCRVLDITLDWYWHGTKKHSDLKGRVMTAVEDAFDQE
ncbi:helix-turn-helix transcriptional regulator [Pseudomaricurvus alkylphenolicus]|uniref:helix-turn-helix transcriptional regulator n=1 Tax=Pseudomaricurvus alkylphenolicus TaxID=1306991 RepID=UPI00141DE50C|nr:helix-turn-helix transcriptional regulator [Pseudomaricurvus alkylphenolicus]NIB43830.1 helix-turn-helix transcriptional regulator [Pseudomaricurvus alkylphenolicus]